MLVSQPVSAVEFAEIAVERAERSMPGFPGDRDHEAIRKADRRPSPKMFDGSGDRIRVLQCEVLMVQQHVDGRGNGLGTAIVDGCKNPRGLDERQMWNPRSTSDERFGRRNFFRIVSRDEPDEHIGISGSHGAV